MDCVRWQRSLGGNCFGIKGLQVMIQPTRQGFAIGAHGPGNAVAGTGADPPATRRDQPSLHSPSPSRHAAWRCPEERGMSPYPQVPKRRGGRPRPAQTPPRLRTGSCAEPSARAATWRHRDPLAQGSCALKRKVNPGQSLVPVDAAHERLHAAQRARAHAQATSLDDAGGDGNGEPLHAEAAQEGSLCGAQRHRRDGAARGTRERTPQKRLGHVGCHGHEGDSGHKRALVGDKHPAAASQRDAHGACGHGARRGHRPRDAARKNLLRAALARNGVERSVVREKGGDAGEAAKGYAAAVITGCEALGCRDAHAGGLS